MDKSLGQEKLAKKVVHCRICRIPAHPTVPVDSNRLVHDLPEFKGLTCFEILHSEQGTKIWKPTQGGKVRYSVVMSHPLVRDLRRQHGLSPNIRRQRQEVAEEEEEEE